ncbi:hypothetical protein Ssi03_60940 [Sphaerisporangium siamense]|uniref:Ribosomal protein L29 n=1 Tax=Sphaerisporangium siamense TaxID=795645 RepID=A0A7W7DC56_9ACTN|nr:DUF4407 domain-containing protein [Sphaerisporangium siamense]MBB4703325.1 ribosomal protein L29 [Sphaerisporangium siamense]GII88104.1 hypothetical protein Ssi03_60940 [Sphaerisporangium siamense]
MRKFLIVLSGARPEILEQCPTDRGKFEGIGGAVLTTAVLATISMSFALGSALGLSFFIAVPAGILWGLAILSLDRWLVGSIPAEGRRRWRLAVPRVLMAVLLGVVISTPLVLQIFKTEIDAQIVEIRQERANSFTTERMKGDAGKELLRLRAAVAVQEDIVASRGEKAQDPRNDPRFKALTAERDAQQKQATKHYDQLQCQLYGGQGCPRKGDGELAQASRDAMNKAKKRVEELNKQIDARKKELTASDKQARATRLESATEQLKELRPQLAAAEEQQRTLQRSFNEENESLNGLLIRLRALNEVSGKDVTLNAARTLLFLLFLLIECLPVAVKLMQKPGNYEKLFEMEARKELMEARTGMRRATRSAPDGAEGAPGRRTTRQIWDAESALDQPPPDATVVGPPTVLDEPVEHGPGPIPEPLSMTHEFGGMEDEALRGMADTRAPAVSNAARPERARARNLFPDDDD